MPKASLHAAQEAIQAALSEKDTFDDSDREALLDLRHEIGVLLEHTEEVERPRKVEAQRRASSIVERFQTEHPLLTDALNRVADTLASMGI